jgi:hypothetical protein
MTNWVLALIISIAGIGVIGIATWLLGLPAIILTIKTIYDMIVK